MAVLDLRETVEDLLRRHEAGEIDVDGLIAGVERALEDDLASRGIVFRFGPRPHSAQNCVASEEGKE